MIPLEETASLKEGIVVPEESTRSLEVLEDEAVGCVRQSLEQVGSRKK